MSRERILVVEDEEDILALIQYNLTREGYSVLCATSGEEGLRLAESGRVDLAVLDLMLPGMDGLEVCRALRRRPATATLPIIMVTAKGEESDVVAGLEMGADDYITKPFSHKVRAARIASVLRRRGEREAKEEEDALLKIHDLTIHPGRNEVTASGNPVELTFTEFRVLRLLAGRPGWVFTRSQIMDAVRGEEYAVTERAVDVQIVGLRKKLGDCGRYIETVRGVGYRFREREDA